VAELDLHNNDDNGDDKVEDEDEGESVKYVKPSGLELANGIGQISCVLVSTSNDDGGATA
jgi:hypothetical protein